MIPVADALALINKHTPASRIVTLKINDPSITGHIIAEDIFATTNVPGFPASIVDGYAVVHTDGAGVYRIAQVSHASPNEVSVLLPGTIARVTTGAVVPEGATAVIPVEETELVSVKDDGKEEDEVRILAEGVQKFDNIRALGSDIKKGELALKAGTLISQVGGEIGLLASIGVTEVNVFRKPKVGVLSTGDELVDLNDGKLPDELKLGQIFDSNRPLLLSFLMNWGFEAVDLGIAKDTSDTTEQKLRDALYKTDIDFIITTGGVSMGELDLLKPTIERKLNGTIHFGRVAMKPGKPTTFATVEINQHHTKKVIFALPGNPASASVTTHLFVLPSLRKFSGVVNPVDPDQLPTLSEIKVTLKKDIRLDPRPEYQRVVISQQGDSLVAETTGFQRSSRVGSMSGSNGLLVLPSSTEVEGGVLKAGETVNALVIGIL
jgi:gephyrin